MPKLRLQVTAISPLSFSARRGAPSAFSETLSYLPGPSLRGSAAAHYLRAIGGADDNDFRAVFAGGAVLFSNLLPERSADEEPYRLERPLPTTARCCKAYRGFLADSSQGDEKHGVSDVLINAVAAKLSGNPALLDHVWHCPRCGQRSEHLAGVYERRPTGQSRLVEVRKRHLPHVGINRLSQTAEDGVLYAQQVVDEFRREAHGGAYLPQTFAGDLVVASDYVEFIQNSLLREGTFLWVGDSRSRGLGRVQVTRCAESKSDEGEQLRQRIEAFNDAIENVSGPTQDRDYVAITLQSDAIVRDEFLRPKSFLDGDDITKAIGAPIPSLNLVYSNGGSRLVQSWNLAAGYPKPDELAIKMGSVFVFEVPAGYRAELAPPLSLLQERGIGRRTTEGFGRLTVCDPFHTEVNELWQTT